MDNVTGIFLRKEVGELRKKGETWGLSKEEIDEAILRALGGKLFVLYQNISKANLFVLLDLLLLLLMQLISDLLIFKRPKRQRIL